MAFVWLVCAHLQLHLWFYVSYSWACSSEYGVARILWFSVNIYSLNPFPFTNECFTKSQSLKLVAIKKEKSNENVAMFPPPSPYPHFLIPPIGARQCCHGDNICWAMSDRSQERSVWEREHLKLKRKWWGKNQQAVFLTQWRLDWKVYFSLTEKKMKIPPPHFHLTQETFSFQWGTDFF